ncbi:vacuolar transporter chaperone KNAG_0G00940 [Huiozyma naganishii CBS 8797]|uniref:SPX domain-containing protein n=1 Tax=Huiozyma naganishii (strain ATCC MYA-139 / BCRC 22969 / CBS 8797 / KCTC 17520 / NBRC 10181 / NCYC 3082 / Yp74L-3) TaxID=1071383 RepID=J7R8F3_HUIN7|nr:hypothetical protein KNAG_0G00940 [Kazachstania naganishii CBS 8797]CCK71150.1 hypothetical protein KNAG_0G00940 [Kazachstania naganishii CBS 8797]
MLFGVRLANDIYPPWKDSYIRYDHLKDLLKEDIVVRDRDALKKEEKSIADARGWTDKDESRFVEALDSELQKVYTFQLNKYNTLMEKLNQLEKQTDTEEKIKTLNSDAFQRILEDSLTEAKELDNFSRLNFTGFVKIVKKHDKLHPKYPSVRSLLEVRLKELPFHSEEYSPLLYRISLLYNILRGNFSTVSKSLASASKLSNFGSADGGDMEFTSFKFWIHEDNLMEVKTIILRHLPVLVYAAAPTENSNMVDKFESDLLDDDEHARSSNSSTGNISERGLQHKSLDPTITNLYFDNEYFELYNNKLLKNSAAPTLRLRWIGKLSERPDIFLEKRMVVETDDGKKDFDETRVKMKQKFLNGFIFNGDTKYKEQMLKKLKGSGTVASELDRLGNDFDELQRFIMQEELQPVLRTIYTRTAFQIPGDDRIRITIDSDILYVREDSFDKSRPIRDPKNWHRTDIDSDVANPLKFLRTGEYAKFPFSVMEIKVKNSNVSQTQTGNSVSALKLAGKNAQWISDLTNSHLVKEVPRFSLYIQGVASLFSDDEKLDVLPFWLPDLENDIRQNPSQAYDEEKKKMKRQKEIQAKIDGMRRLSKIQMPSSPSHFPQGEIGHRSDTNADLEDHESSDEESAEAQSTTRSKMRTRKRKEPTFLKILVGRDSKLIGVDSEDEEIDLPSGVKRPETLLKNAGPIKVETKVWLANERTFNRWLRVTTLLSVLTFSIYNSVKKAAFPGLANTLAFIYFALTLFCGIWSYVVYLKRLNVIKQRSGQHLDAPLGPIIVALVLIVSLVINFVVAFREAALKGSFNTAVAGNRPDDNIPQKLVRIQSLIYKLVGAES